MSGQGLPTAAVPFDGDPLELKHILEAEARARPGKWSQRIMGGKVFVALRLSVEHRRWELIIWREAIPHSLEEKSRWESRVRDLQRSLKCLHFERGEDVVRDDRVAASFSCASIDNSAAKNPTQRAEQTTLGWPVDPTPRRLS